MQYDEAEAKTTIKELETKRSQIELKRIQVTQTLSSLLDIVDVETSVPDPDAPPSKIGGNTKVVLVRPKDKDTGQDVTDARRDEIYTKRMAEADTLLL